MEQPRGFEDQHCQPLWCQGLVLLATQGDKSANDG
jgi:hypothetical protein